MNQQVDEAVPTVSELQDQLRQAIDGRHMVEGKQYIDALSGQDTDAQRPSSLNRYVHSHQPATPFLHAIARGNPELALYLLEKGCNPFADTDSGKEGSLKFPEVRRSKTLFKLFEKAGFQKVFCTVLEKAEELIVNKNGDSALHIIVKKKLIVLFEVALRSKWLARMMKHYNNQGYLPLHIAASSNFVEFFQVFSQQCCPISLLRSNLSADCDSSLFSEDHSDCKDIQNGTSCYLRDNVLEASKNLKVNTALKYAKCTALHLAAREKSLVIVKILLQLGANANCLDECGRTALIECLDHRGEKNITSSLNTALYEVCRTLLESGANANVRSHIRFSERRSMSIDDILTPLHLAARIGLKNVVELLLENGSNPCQFSGDTGKIPAQFALEQGHNEAALTLLRSRLYPDGFLAQHADYAFNSLLHSADKCNPEVTQLLVQLQCPLDRPNVNHLRPLDKAISSKNISFVQLLLDTQPSIVNVQLYQDPKAYPPLHLAASSGDVTLCRLILSYGADIYTRAYGKHPAYRKALRFNRHEVAVFLCEQMSRPFPPQVQEDLKDHLDQLETPLSQRLKHRLESVPSLVALSLDAIRQVFIKKYLCFKYMDHLPLPASLIRALKYQNIDCSG
ncbi:ankyrin-1 [Aplysia californica]|uniref:Ankyrin-1 n=1 Tax=Aplysia californica TaxID=6500 RepID=A0ABM0JEA1_APLCA|nr:ankyrin-1 [Aplysia californica]